MAELKRQGADLYRHLASQISQNANDPKALNRLVQELQSEAQALEQQQGQQGQQGQQQGKQQGQQQPQR